MNLLKKHVKPAHQKNEAVYNLKARTLIESLAQRVRSERDFLIFMDGKNQEHKLSAAEAWKGSEAVAQYLAAMGLKKNDKVLVMLPTSTDFVFTYFGILMAGGIPVPVSQPAGTNNLEKYMENLKHIIVNCEARFFIAHARIKALIAGLVNINGLVDHFLSSAEILENPVPEDKYGPLPCADADDIALIQYTSGTTGKPKGVLLSHKNLLHNVHGIGVASAMNDSDVGISWLPLYHDMGLIGGMFATMYWGLPLVLMMPEVFLLKPSWWMLNITRYRVTMAVAPNFGYHYCATRIPEKDLDGIDLQTWRLALNGAEPIDRATLTRFIEKFRPCGLRDDIFLPVYGMAENSLAATFPDLSATTVVRRFERETLEEKRLAVESDGDDPRDTVDLVSVGYPLVGQEIRIADEHGRTRDQGEVGQILVKSPSLTPGYYRNEKASSDAIKDGWLHTGDMGFILDDMLFISGRIKEMIIKRGKNIYPYDVERIAQSVKGVRLGCCAAFAVPNEEQGTEDLVLVVETYFTEKDEMRELERTISSEIVARLGISPDIIRLVPKGSIPKTSSGKLQRVQCRRNYLEGNLVPSRNWNYIVLARTLIMSSVRLFRLKLSRLMNAFVN